MAFNFHKFYTGINVVPKSAAGNNQGGDLEFLNSTNKLYLHNGSFSSPVLTESGSAVIQNKTIDITNTVDLLDTNFLLQNSADQSKSMRFDLSGLSVSQALVVPVSGQFVFTTATQTLSNKSLVDNSTFIINNSDSTKRVQFSAASVTSGQTRTVTIPDVSTTMVGTAVTQTLSNKTLDNTNVATLEDNDLTLQNASDNTKQANFSLAGLTTGTTRTYALPDGNTTLVGIALSQTLSNKTLDNTNSETLLDQNFVLQSSADTTKQARFSLAALSSSATRVYGLPNASTTLVGIDTAQTLTNKSIDASLNSLSNIPVADLTSGVATSGQVATANGSGGVAWQTPQTGTVKNFLDNSNFYVWQRGTAQNGFSGATWGADRWFISSNGNSINFGQTNGASGATTFGFGVQVSTASSPGNPLILAQTLENSDSIQLFNQTASFGARFQARGNVTQLSIQFSYATSEAAAPAISNFIGSPVIVNVNTGSFTSGQILGQALGTSMSIGGVVGIVIQTHAVSSGNVSDVGNGFTMEQPVLNLGSTVTTYAPKSPTPQGELAECQRYLWRPQLSSFFASGYYNTGTQCIFLVEYPVYMRAVPFLSISSAGDFVITRPGSSAGNGTGSTSFSNTGNQTTEFIISNNGASTTGFVAFITVTGAGFFEASAEI